jgi:hypothetical protein
MLGQIAPSSRPPTTRMLMSNRQRSSVWCECGRPKSHGASACNRCGYLDGCTDLIGFAIAALRGCDGLSLVELREAVYGSATTCRNPDRILLRLVQTLMARGRLRRYWREIEVDRRAGECRWGHGLGCWVYSLDAAPL